MKPQLYLSPPQRLTTISTNSTKQVKKVIQYTSHGSSQATTTPLSPKMKLTKLRKNSLKTRLPKNIWRTLGNIRAWFTKSLVEKSMLWSRLIYLKAGMSGVELILEVPTLPHVYGLRRIRMTTFILQENITKQGRRLIFTLDSSTAILLAKELNRLLETPVVHNGSASSPKEASTSPRPTKKSGQTSTRGSGSAWKKSVRNLNRYQEKLWKAYIVGERKVNHRFLSLVLAQTSSKSLKPTVGKKSQSPELKT